MVNPVDGELNPEIQSEKLFIIHSETAPDKTGFKRKVCVVGVIDGSKLKVGVAQCNKVDFTAVDPRTKKAKYTKKLARTIATGRLNKKGIVIADLFRDNEPNSLAAPKEIVRIMHEHVGTLKVK